MRYAHVTNKLLSIDSFQGDYGFLVSSGSATATNCTFTGYTTAMYTGGALAVYNTVAVGAGPAVGLFSAITPGGLIMNNVEASQGSGQAMIQTVGTGDVSVSWFLCWLLTKVSTANKCVFS